MFIPLPLWSTTNFKVIHCADCGIEYKISDADSANNPDMDIMLQKSSGIYYSFQFIFDMILFTIAMAAPVIGIIGIIKIVPHRNYLKSINKYLFPVLVVINVIIAISWAAYIYSISM